MQGGPARFWLLVWQADAYHLAAVIKSSGEWCHMQKH